MYTGYDKRFSEGGFCGNIQKYFAHSVIYRSDPFKHLFVFIEKWRVVISEASAPR